MRHEIQTSITIHADSKTVWKIFSDFSDYPHWNPFIKKVDGKIAVGEQISVELGGMKFKPKVQEFKREQKFSWLGRLLFPGIFDGRHSFELIANPDGSTTFIHSEKFKGILVPLMKKKLNTEIKDHFEAMNRSLKEQAEK